MIDVATNEMPYDPLERRGSSAFNQTIPSAFEPHDEAQRFWQPIDRPERDATNAFQSEQSP